MPVKLVRCIECFTLTKHPPERCPHFNFAKTGGEGPHTIFNWQGAESPGISVTDQKPQREPDMRWGSGCWSTNVSHLP